MAFLSERLKVVLATIHVPLRVSHRRITRDAIFEKLEILISEFPRLGLHCRKVAVAGLNPHAGEAGLLGSEEIEQIVPASTRRARCCPRSPSKDRCRPTPCFTAQLKGNLMRSWRCTTTRD